MATRICDLTGSGITSGFGFEGADLGYLWDTDQGFCMAVFGDTFDGPTPDDGAGWRSPVALRTSTAADALNDGIVWDNAVGGIYARQLFDYERVAQPNYDDDAFTVIPNDGVTLPDGRHLLSAFAVGDWTGGPDATWRSNFAELFMSTQGHGEDWQRCRDEEADRPHLRWYNADRDGCFQNQSFLLRGGYLHVFGTPSGRQVGAGVYLMRAPWARLCKRSTWQWWGYHDGTWSWGAHEPSAIFRSLCPWTAIGEINVREIDGVLVFAYADGGFCWTRTADAPDGPWTPPKPQASGVEIPSHYAPAIHPWSSLAELHFQISQWPQRTEPNGGTTTRFYGTRQWRGNGEPLFESVREFTSRQPAPPAGAARQAHLIEARDAHRLADVVSELGGESISVDTIRTVMPGLDRC